MAYVTLMSSNVNVGKLGYPKRLRTKSHKPTYNQCEVLILEASAAEVYKTPDLMCPSHCTMKLSAGIQFGTWTCSNPS